MKMNSIERFQSISKIKVSQEGSLMMNFDILNF
jgi:hypothetical protein